MKKSDLQQIIREEIIKELFNTKENLDFEKRLKKYLDSDVHVGGNVSLQSVFGNENVVHSRS